MARRGLMTALQAALAGAAGAAGGYAQQQELERKRIREEEDRKERAAAAAAGLRAEQRTIRSLGGAQIAGMGEQVAGPMPSAIPLSGVGNAFAEAEKAAGGMATSRGALRQDVGGTNFILPSMEEVEARQAERTRTAAQQERDDENRRDFDTFREIYGGRGEYNPSVNYDQAIKKAEAQAGRGMTEYQRQSLALERQKLEQAGKKEAPVGRGPLPTVLSTSERLKGMSEKEVLALRPSGVAAATQAPLTLAESRGGFSGLLSFPVAAGMNIYARPEEQEYAQMVRAVTDAVARASEKGVLTDRDIGRFQAQTAFLPGEGNKMMLQKFSNLKAWADWLANVEQNPTATTTRLPGESETEAAQRSSMLRQGNAGGRDNRTEDQRDWDDAVAKYGRTYVENQYGPRP
jgi:hypothetical protein